MKKTTPILLFIGMLLATIAYTSHADVFDYWTTNQIIAPTNFYNSYPGQMHHAVYGNGLYVAYAEQADGGDIYTSQDGLNWALQFSDNNSWGMTLNYSSGHFAGVGGFGIVNVSTNGTNWTSTFLPWQETGDYASSRAITYGHGLYVTVGASGGVGDVLTSSDGVTWTSRSISGSVGSLIYSVAWGNNRFVAVGNNDGLAYTSSGLSVGTNWTQQSIPGGNKVSFANGLFFVPLNNKTNLISINGISWSQQPTGLTNLMGNVTYVSGLYMAQCDISYTNIFLATSTDGINWIQYARPVPSSFSSDDLPDLDGSMASDGTRLVCVGDLSGSFICTSGVLVDVRLTNYPPHSVALSGLIGRTCQIQSADSLNVGANGWRTNTTLQLPTTPYVWTDSAATNSARFYRGALLP